MAPAENASFDKSKTNLLDETGFLLDYNRSSLLDSSPCHPKSGERVALLKDEAGSKKYEQVFKQEDNLV